MEKEFYHVKTAIDTMDKLQTKHIESFQKELLPDLERQNLERNKAFEMVRYSLHQFFKQADFSEEPQTEDMVATVKNLITRLQQQTQILVEKVEAYKTDLQARMGNLSKGRQAIKSYGPPSSFSKRSRVLSLTN
jgi:molecular chaperone DnaK (HSP70)